jgi:soluble lytic murein transglycosylase-like protein
MGIAQIMPATFAELASKMGYTGISAYDPAYGIALGAYYMADLRSKWSSPRPTNDRHLLAVASYNAGFGNLLRSQMVCGNPNLFADIFRCLPQVTGSHAQETIGYVNRIQRYRGIMAYD